MLTPSRTDQIVETALQAVRSASDWKAVLDELPVPTYITDADGAVTYWNRACVHFAGRQPRLGQDRWCVTWKLYTTTGDRLLHEDCPMAAAIKGQCEIRGEVAIALRPDGTRRAFTPYPTPLFDQAGNLTGAVNLLIDVTDEQSEALHAQAEHCRRLADATYDRATNKVLGDMAAGFEKTAKGLSGKRS